MSITISPTSTPVTHYTIECIACTTNRGRTDNTISTEAIADYNDACAHYLALQAGTSTMPGCEAPADHKRDAYFVQANSAADEGMPWVNMANANAGFILSTLGLDTGCGTIPTNDFNARLTMAAAVEPYDQGIAPTVSTTPFGGTSVYCGRRTGYLQDRLRDFQAVVAWAQEHERDITWS